MRSFFASFAFYQIDLRGGLSMKYSSVSPMIEFLRDPLRDTDIRGSLQSHYREDNAYLARRGYTLSSFNIQIIY